MKLKNCIRWFLNPDDVKYNRRNSNALLTPKLCKTAPCIMTCNSQEKAGALWMLFPEEMDLQLRLGNLFSSQYEQPLEFLLTSTDHSLCSIKNS